MGIRWVKKSASVYHGFSDSRRYELTRKSSGPLGPMWDVAAFGFRAPDKCVASVGGGSLATLLDRAKLSALEWENKQASTEEVTHVTELAAYGL